MTPTEREDALARLENGFMVPDIRRADVWEVQANHGETHYVPANLVGKAPRADELQTYVEGTVDTDEDGNPDAVLLRGRWLARLSAPGYTDQTDLSVHDTREDAEEYLIDMYDDGEDEDVLSGGHEPMINDYASAANYLGIKQDRPLSGRATRIIRRSETDIAIRYQATDVVTYHADGTATLNSNGWQTVTTKARFTEYTRVRVYSDKGTWCVAMSDRWDDGVPPALYRDGMRIDASGRPTDPQYPTPTDKQRKRTLDRDVAAYIKGFADHVAEHGLDDPSSGDCWACLSQVQGASTPTQGSYRLQGKQTPHGRVEPMGLSHYLDHIREKYYVPSLLMNAIIAAGYREPAYMWYTIKTYKDRDMVARVLRGYFRNLKPALLALND